MDRLEWLKDRITQMGHPPHLYEKWQAEIERLQNTKPVVKVGNPSKRKKQPSNYRSKVLKRLVSASEVPHLSDQDRAALANEVVDELARICAQPNFLPPFANWTPFRNEQ